MAMEQFRAPALQNATPQYDQQALQQLVKVLRIYFNQLDSETPNKAYSYRADKFILNLAASVVEDPGNLSWNSVDATMNLGMEYGVTQQVGQETYARVANQTGVTIPNGSVVGFAGATANALLVTPYLADGSQPSLYILGVMTHDLPDSGEKGYCTTWGFVRDLDTSAFSAGDVLYASPTTAGAFTNVKPTAPDNVIPVAACIISDATNGIIFVRPTIEQMEYYGEFSATVDQTAAVINTAYAVAFNSTSISNGVVIGSPTSRIVVPASGLYRVDVNMQIASTSSSSKNLWCWFRKNGVDIPNSARITTSDINNGFVSMTHDCTVSLGANEYIEVMYAADSTNIFLDATAPTAFAPGSPAAQVAITQAQQ
jgi:DNA-binding protein Fis